MKNSKQLLWLAFLTFCIMLTIPAQNQVTVDSLQNLANAASLIEKPAALNQLAEALISQSVAKAIQTATESVIVAEKNNNANEQAHAYKILSSCNILNGQIDEALNNSKKAIDIYLKIGKMKEVAETFNQLGLIYKQKRNFSKSSENFQKAIEYYTIVNDSSGIASTNGYLGSLSLIQNDYGNAIKYFQISLQIRNRKHDFAPRPPRKQSSGIPTQLIPL